MKKIWNEFKSFAFKGNVLDMAVGVIIGAAFGKIVSSLVSDLVSPLLGLLTGGVRFDELAYELRAATEQSEALILKYGLFFQNIIDFLLIAISIFVVIKAINSTKASFAKKEAAKAEEAKAEEPPAPTVTEELLSEIRDLLKKTPIEK